jgi:hypothetical protein
MMFPEVVVERLATGALEQRMKVHVSAVSLGEARSISFTYSADTCFAALVANFPALVAATTIKAYSPTFSSH